MISPEFWSDEEIGHWSFQARLFYIGLWNFADDEGRFRAHNSLLKSEIFPYDDKIDVEKIKHELKNKVQWYEHDGSQYGFVRNFLKHQSLNRPTISKLPPPPQLTEDSLNNHGGLTPNRKEGKGIEENVGRMTFHVPTHEEIVAYKKEANLVFNPHDFFDFYQSKNWMVGRNKMKDWKAAARRWARNTSFKDSAAKVTQQTVPSYEQSQAYLKSLEGNA